MTSQKAKKKAKEDLQKPWKVMSMKEIRSLLAEIAGEYSIFIMIFILVNQRGEQDEAVDRVCVCMCAGCVCLYWSLGTAMCMCT